jgi:hypothetical protein
MRCDRDYEPLPADTGAMVAAVLLLALGLAGLAWALL